MTSVCRSASRGAAGGLNKLFHKGGDMSICPVCGKVWTDETDTNMGLCSVDCQTQWRKVIEVIVPEEPHDMADYDDAVDGRR